MNTDLRTRVRRFVDDHVVPAEDRLDTGPDLALRAAARAEGLWALPLPATLGGGDLPLADYLALAEDEGRSDHGPDVLGSSSLLTVRTIGGHAHDDLAAAILPRVVAGEFAVAFAMTEPGVAGSDPARLRTRATAQPDGRWTVTGRKWFVSAAARADVVLTVAVTDRGPTVFAVPTDTPGFRVVTELDVLGAGGQYEIAFDDAVVPATHVIGEVGAGLRVAGDRLALGRTLRALRWIGQAQRCLELLADRAATREVGDGVLADLQLVHRAAFECELAVRSARLLAREAAAAVVAGARAPVEISLAKTAAARALHAAVDATIQVYGAEGLTPGTGLPRLLRVARTARILDGADEWHVTTTGRRLLNAYH